LLIALKVSLDIGLIIIVVGARVKVLLTAGVKVLSNSVVIMVSTSSNNIVIVVLTTIATGVAGAAIVTFRRRLQGRFNSTNVKAGRVIVNIASSDDVVD
jgi:hypothetical protein